MTTCHLLADSMKCMFEQDPCYDCIDAAESSGAPSHSSALLWQVLFVCSGCFALSPEPPLFVFSVYEGLTKRRLTVYKGQNTV